MAEAQVNSEAVCEHMNTAGKKYDWEMKKFERLELKKK